MTKNPLSQLASIGEEVIGKAAQNPTASRVLQSALQLKERVDDLSRRVRGLEAMERRIELLKASGFNAVRCSHNPPAQAFLEAADRLGMLVIDEAFDMWADGKNPHDYHLWFDKWWQRDLESMIARDRNHPSVIAWSIGNEIPGMDDPRVVETAKTLAAFVRKTDPTRPVLAAVNNLNPKKDPFMSALDIAGYNYGSGGDHQ